MKVRITRQAKEYHEIGEIEVGEISGVKWDDESGGYKEKYGFYSLYGYIDYQLAMELVDCSGAHEKYGSLAKICILEKLNDAIPYKEGYEYLLSKASNSKPQSKIAQNRPQGYPPCTKYILQVLDEYDSITRKELRGKLTKEIADDGGGYKLETIRRALFQLVSNKKISISYEKNRNNQVITKLKN